MLNRSASLAMLTSVLKALPGKLDIKRHSLFILYKHASSGLGLGLHLIHLSVYDSSTVSSDTVSFHRLIRAFLACLTPMYIL